MKRRFKLKKKASRKMFAKGVNKVKAINVGPSPMRGGFRF